MLAGNSRVHTFPETHFFDRLFWGKRANVFRGFRARRILQDVASLIGLDRESMPGFSYSRKPFIRAYFGLLDAVAMQAGKQLWLEKTPPHLHFIDQIAAYSPEARFVHLLRDGRAVVASLFDMGQRFSSQWPWAHSLDACIDRWNWSIRDSFVWLDHPRHLLCAYETLVSQPEELLRVISKFLDIDFEPQMLAFQQNAGKVTQDFEKWKRDVSAPLSPKGLEKYDRLFDEGQKQYIEKRIEVTPQDPRWPQLP